MSEGELPPPQNRPKNIRVPEPRSKDIEPPRWEKVEFPENEWKLVKLPWEKSEDETPEMTYFIESELPEIFGKYEYLCNREDDSATPFHSKYSARDKLIDVRARVTELLGADSSQPSSDSTFPTAGPQRLLHALALIDCRIGVNFIHTEEYHSGQMYIEHCLQHFSVNVETFPVELLDTYNQLGILWCNREDFKKSEEYLLLAKKFYHELVDGEKTKSMFRSEMTEQEAELFRDRLLPSKSIEKVEEYYTLNTFFLAQVYGHMGQPDKSAEFCQLCLERQLDKFEVLNLVDFAYNCMGLYSYYVMCEHYPQAEYFLHSANYVLKRAKDPTPRTKQYHDREGGLPQAHAELHKVWGRFYALLLKLGWQYQSGEKAGDYAPKDLLLTFKSLPTFILASTSLPSSFEEALKMFKLAELALDNAKSYYQLDGWVTDHLEILQEQSNMFSILANFEDDIPRKCKMLKRKINLFEPIINDLNPRIYVDTIRNLSHELAETYQEIADLKAQDDEEGHVQKINELCFKAIRYLKMLFKTFQSPSSMEYDVPEAWMPMFISGQLALARLHTRFIHYDITQQVQQHEVALQTYEFLVNFLTKKDHDKFPMELKMCKEMCELLPLKIGAIRAGKGDLFKKTSSTNT